MSRLFAFTSRPVPSVSLKAANYLWTLVYIDLLSPRLCCDYNISARFVDHKR